MRLSFLSHGRGSSWCAPHSPTGAPSWPSTAASATGTWWTRWEPPSWDSSCQPRRWSWAPSAKSDCRRVARTLPAFPEGFLKSLFHPPVSSVLFCGAWKWLLRKAGLVACHRGALTRATSRCRWCPCHVLYPWHSRRPECDRWHSQRLWGYAGINQTQPKNFERKWGVQLDPFPTGTLLTGGCDGIRILLPGKVQPSDTMEVSKGWDLL